MSAAGRRGPLASVLAVTLVLSACAADAALPALPKVAASDVNARDPATLRDGGVLRRAMSSFPANFNPLHRDASVDYRVLSDALYPRAFDFQADGTLRLNTDYFTRVERISADPQVVVYTINPRARWSDGSPITWEDIASQIRMLAARGVESDLAGMSGYDLVGSVTRGGDDREAVVTFTRPYPEWRAMFSGESALLPRTMTATAADFDDGARLRPGPTAGPFVVSEVDRSQRRITLVRNPQWWGTPPRLDTITATVMPRARELAALRDGDLDVARLADAYDVAEAQAVDGFTVRRAPERRWTALAFNGAPASVFSDARLRQAVSHGIDREAIVAAVQRRMTDAPALMHNHVFVPGEPGYENNSCTCDFDPARAREELDALGWRMNGAVREKNGRALIVRYVPYGTVPDPGSAQMVRSDLARIGVQLVVDDAPTGDPLQTGDFDILQATMTSDGFPLRLIEQAYAGDGPVNAGRIADADVDAVLRQARDDSTERSADRRADQIDVILWDIAFGVPLAQSLGTVAVPVGLANYGAFGLADIDYAAVGYTE